MAQVCICPLVLPDLSFQKAYEKGIYALLSRAALVCHTMVTILNVPWGIDELLFFYDTAHCTAYHWLPAAYIGFYTLCFQNSRFFAVSPFCVCQLLIVYS